MYRTMQDSGQNDAGNTMEDGGYRTEDVGYRMDDIDYRLDNAEYRMKEVGNRRACRIKDKMCIIHHEGCRIKYDGGEYLMDNRTAAYILSSRCNDLAMVRVGQLYAGPKSERDTGLPKLLRGQWE
jgi:hypothetical protein